MKVYYFHTLKVLWDSKDEIKMYYGMSRVKKQLSGKRSIERIEIFFCHTWLFGNLVKVTKYPNFFLQTLFETYRRYGHKSLCNIYLMKEPSCKYMKMLDKIQLCLGGLKV